MNDGKCIQHGNKNEKWNVRKDIQQEKIIADNLIKGIADRQRKLLSRP